MAVDLNRIIQAAAEAALDQQSAPQSRQQDGKQRKLLTAPRALLVGAGLATAGRLLVRARGGNLMENVQQRLATFESTLGLSDDEPEDEEYDDFDEDEDVEDEPYDEAEDEPYDEEEPEDEPYDEAEEEPEDVEADQGDYDEGEPEDEADEEEPEDQASDDDEPEDEDAEEDDEEPEPERRGSRRAGAGGRRGRR